MKIYLTSNRANYAQILLNSLVPSTKGKDDMEDHSQPTSPAALKNPRPGKAAYICFNVFNVNVKQTLIHFLSSPTRL